MENLNYHIIIFLFFIIPLKLNGQYLLNPSFEGTVGIGNIPQGWNACDPTSSPDTQPGVLLVDLPPSDGETYLSLRTRSYIVDSSDIEFINTREDIQTTLMQPLIIGRCYTFSIDLAYDSIINYISITIPSYPPRLKVWGGWNYCDSSEVLFETGVIDHTYWKTYTFNIVPKLDDCNNLFLMPLYGSDTAHHSLLLVDNIRISESTPSETQLMLDTTIMVNQPVILNASESEEYEWSPLAGLSCYDCKSPVAQTDENVIYSVTLLDSNSCKYSQNFIINVINCEDVMIEKSSEKLDTTIAAYSDIQLTASQSSYYDWNPKENLSCIDCYNPIVNILDPTVYICTLYDDFGCQYEESFKIEILLEVPNVITPNQDGKNDVFKIPGLPDNTNLTIFDRFGSVLYYSDNYQNDWNGKSDNNEVLESGTYWYLLINEKSAINLKGYVYVKK